MKRIRTTQIIISINFLWILLAYSCDNEATAEAEVVTLIDKASNKIEKGVILNRKREGYWVVFDTNYNIRYDIQYINDMPNGKSTQYLDNAIFIETEYSNGITNGAYTSYHKYPIINAQGKVKMSKRIGEWKLYTSEGKLNKVIVYENDTMIIKVNNNLDALDFGDENPRKSQ